MNCIMLRTTMILFFVLSNTCFSEEIDKARYLLNEQLSMPDNKDIKTHVKVLERTNKFTLVDKDEKSRQLEVNKNDKEKGYVLFVRDYTKEIYYNTIPQKEELKNNINIFVTLGESEPFAVGVYPLKDLQGVEAVVEDFENEKGDKILKKNIDVRWVRYMARAVDLFVYMMAPEAMEKFSAVDIKNGITTSFWFIVKIPEDAKGGMYKGRISIITADRKSSSIEVSLNVLPFKLNDTGAKFGWYYHEPEDESKLKEELKDMKEHGINALCGKAPRITKVTGNSVELDFSGVKKFIGICKSEEIEVVEGNVGEFVGDLKRLGIKELSSSFSAPFKDAVAKTHKWMMENGNPNYIFDVFDEPREQGLNDWNRNMADTIKYLELCREIPGVKTEVIIMADTNSDKDYTRMVPFLDVVNTHQWPKSKGLMQKAKELGKSIWTNNNGFGRASWGFCLWRAGITGRWQYAYYGFKKTDKPFSPVRMMSDAPGKSNARVSYSATRGIIPSIKYEWVREGIDDYKYIITLESLINDLSLNKSAKESLEKAKRVLDKIHKEIPYYPPTGLVTGTESGEGGGEGDLSGSLDGLRWDVAQSILELQNYIKK